MGHAQLRGRIHRGLVVSALVAVGCGSPPPTSREALESATYLTTDGTVTLEAGEALAQTPGAIEYQLFATAEGDLDLDGELDAAVVVIEFDGRKELVRLHALLSDGRSVADVSARLLGDRVGLKLLSIEDGLIRADLLTRHPGQPVAVEPTVTVSTYHALTERGLVPVRPMAPVEPSSPSGATPGELDGRETALSTHEWRLTSIDMGDWSGDPSVLEQAPTLQFLAELSDPGGVSGQLTGFAGCNRIFGSFRAEGDATLRMAGLGMTRRACSGAVGDFERRLVAAYGSIESYGITGQILEIAFVGGTLRFEAAGRLVPAEAPGSEDAVAPEESREATRST